MTKRLSKGQHYTGRVKAARERFHRSGKSVKDWADAHGFSPSLVYGILAGKHPCHRGQSHKVAVLLGIKDGIIDEV